MVTSSLKKLAGVGGMLGSEASPHEIASLRTSPPQQACHHLIPRVPCTSPELDPRPIPPIVSEQVWLAAQHSFLTLKSTNTTTLTCSRTKLIRCLSMATTTHTLLRPRHRNRL